MASDMQRFALIQLNVGPDPAENLPITLGLMEQAADKGAEFILTPECSNFLTADGNSPQAKAVLQDEDALLAATQNFCQRRGVWVCLGSLILGQKGTDKLLNRQILIDPKGEIVQSYDKIHLFDVQLDDAEGYQESRTYVRGTQAKITQVDGLQVGHAICYDLRFPGLFRGLSADIQLLPAAFTKTTGQAHWHTLLRARAIENGGFVLAAAQTGTHDGTRQTYGHSLAIDPWGEVLVDMGVDPGVRVFELDLNQIARRRAQVPAMTADQPFDFP